MMMTRRQHLMINSFLAVWHAVVRWIVTAARTAHHLSACWDIENIRILGRLEWYAGNPRLTAAR